jgi:uncharacterized membrane protein
MQHKWLYGGVLIALGALVLLSLGGGFWGGETGSRHWTSNLFYGVCHQMPDRTFHLNEIPMAVNTRCFGIFAGLFAGWAAIPLLSRKLAGSPWPSRILLLAVVLQIIDYSGNAFEIWENTNTSRFIFGIILGIPASLTAGTLFSNSKTNT